MHTCKTAGATHLREVRSSLAGRRRRSPGATRSSCCRPDACFPRRPCRRLSDARSRKLRQVHIMIVLIEIVLPVPRAQQVRCTMDPWYCTGPGTGYRLTGKQVQVPSYCRASRTAVLGWSLFCSAALLGPCAHQSALLVRVCATGGLGIEHPSGWWAELAAARSGKYIWNTVHGRTGPTGARRTAPYETGFSDEL